jgi:adenylate cyclase
MPILSIEYRIKFGKVLTIVVAWLAVGVGMTFYESNAARSMIVQQGGTAFDLGQALTFNLSAALMGSVLGGSFLVFYVNERFRARPYGWTVLAVAVAFVLIISLITIVMGLVVASRNGPFADAEWKRSFIAFVGDTMHRKNILLWGPVVMITQFTLQISDKFGPRVFWRLLWGRYNVPREEERIFMFCDLKSSTSIAESLGNERYHLLLRDYFADLTDPIQYSRGEIYQYVGDEVVVSWTAESGLRDDQCFRCFFAMKDALAERAFRYEERYGVVPTFKAGMHMGHVVAGEIGIIKRDITYSGDVLNTTARIQAQCNTHGVDLLCSAALLDRSSLGLRARRHDLGELELRGKEGRVGVGTVRAEEVLAN